MYQRNKYFTIYIHETFQLSQIIIVRKKKYFLSHYFLYYLLTI